MHVSSACGRNCHHAEASNAITNEGRCRFWGAEVQHPCGGNCPAGAATDCGFPLYVCTYCIYESM